VIVVVSGMDGYKERSVALYKDSWMERGYAVLAFEGPGYWEPPLRGIYVDVPGWAESGKIVADWLAKRPEVDAGKDRHDRGELRLVLHRDHDGGGLPVQSLRGERHLLRAGRRNHLQPRLADLQEALHVHVRHHRRARLRRIPQTIDWNGYAQKVKGAYLVACGEYDQLCPLEYTESFMKALAGRSSFWSMKAAITASP